MRRVCRSAVQEGSGGISGNKWICPRAVSGEALVNLCNTGPMLLHRQMIVLHDAAVAALPRNYTLAFRAWYLAMIRAYGHQAKIIGTVSKFSAG